MPDALFSLLLDDADATDRLGAAFARLLRAGDVLLLEGQIGAGKTHFARAVIRTLLAANGAQEDIPSPTFTLVQTYDAGTEIWHSDLYRLTSPDEAIELGLEEAFDSAICLVEWSDRLGDLAPDRALTLRFSYENEGQSRRVEGFGDRTWRGRLVAFLEDSDG
jgi:tRNA threonylcarbamoyladenosine biosynthesis protein TsaE